MGSLRSRSRVIPTKANDELRQYQGAAPKVATVDLGLRGGTQKRFTLSLFDMRKFERRLSSCECQHPNRCMSPFFLFDSEGYRVYVNIGQVVYSRLSGQSRRTRAIKALPPVQIRAGCPMIRVWLKCQEHPLEFEGSQLAIEKKVANQETPVKGLEGLFSALARSSFNGFVSLPDVEKTDVYLRINDIAMISIPLWLVRPKVMTATI